MFGCDAECLPDFKAMEALQAEKRPLGGVPLTGQDVVILVTVHDHDANAEDKLMGR